MSLWKNLGERTVYENRWGQVNMADVEPPNGRHLDHTVIRLRPVAVATVVNEWNESWWRGPRCLSMGLRVPAHRSGTVGRSAIPALEHGS